MKNYFIQDEWQIIEEGFNAEYHEAAESIFSIGNGKMGQRAMFEEQYSGPTLQGSYVAGVYYPDKTRVGWWKNGYPGYFAKVLNSPNWIGMDIQIDGTSIDLYQHRPKNFKRILDMKSGLLQRIFTVEINGKKIEVKSERFLSRTKDEIGCIRYSIKSEAAAQLKWRSFIDAFVKNKDSNYDEIFWSRISEHASTTSASLQVKTNKLNFHLAFAMRVKHFIGDENVANSNYDYAEWNVSNHWDVQMQANKWYTIEKYVSMASDLYFDTSELIAKSEELVSQAYNLGYDELKTEHVASWGQVWGKSRHQN